MHSRREVRLRFRREVLEGEHGEGADWSVWVVRHRPSGARVAEVDARRARDQATAGGLRLPGHQPPADSGGRDKRQPQQGDAWNQPAGPIAARPGRFHIRGAADAARRDLVDPSQSHRHGEAQQHQDDQESQTPLWGAECRKDDFAGLQQHKGAGRIGDGHATYMPPPQLGDKGRKPGACLVIPRRHHSTTCLYLLGLEPVVPAIIAQ